MKVYDRCEVVVKSNNSLATPGALSNRLQCCTVSKRNGLQQLLKWHAGSEKELLGAPNNFSKIFDSGIPSKRNKQQRRKNGKVQDIL